MHFVGLTSRAGTRGWLLYFDSVHLYVRGTRFPRLRCFSLVYFSYAGRPSDTSDHPSDFVIMYQTSDQGKLCSRAFALLSFSFLSMSAVFQRFFVWQPYILATLTYEQAQFCGHLRFSPRFHTTRKNAQLRTVFTQSKLSLHRIDTEVNFEVC